MPWNGLWYAIVEFPGHTHLLLYGPCPDKTCLPCSNARLKPDSSGTECSNFTLSSKFRFDTFQLANNKGAI